MTYEELRRLEGELRLVRRDLEEAEYQIDHNCCADHGLDEVSRALKTVRAAYALVAGKMLDALRAESRAG